MTPEEIQEYWPDIVDTMQDGLVLIGPDGNIKLINKSMANMTGYSREEIVGQPCTVFHCDACEMVRLQSDTNWCSLFDSEDGKREQCKCSIVAKGGKEIPILKNAAILRNAQGDVIGAVETVRDLSELNLKDRKIKELFRRLANPKEFCGMIGNSAAMQDIFSLVEKSAASDVPVLVLGESGVGKELVARSIHKLSQRSEGPFIQLNCAALNESLLESELFGHVKGAFTGAYRQRPGRFEAASGGSIFLDEIGEMPMSSQVKLLRVLETMQVERVGDYQPIQVDVRIIAATNRNLSELIRQGRFREDLYFRINVVPINLPPLRERREDIPLLVNCLLKGIANNTGKNIEGLSHASLGMFMQYDWPGNVRELKSALEYACVLADAGSIEPRHLPETLLGNSDGNVQPVQNWGADPPEKAALISALEQAGGNKSAAARILGVSRGTVWNRMNKYGLRTNR